MSDQHDLPHVDSYFCPGQRHPISRAVHLGRLAAFYPPCRQCKHAEDTGEISPQHAEKLREVHSRVRPTSVFHSEGAGGVNLNDLTPTAAHRIAMAFAATVLEHSPVATIVLGCDGRPTTAEMTSAACEGLRFGGCDVIDIGPATGACLAFAVHQFGCAGGMFVGNPSREPHRVGLQFWMSTPSDRHARPLSLGAGLDAIAERYRSDAGRPARAFGGLRRESGAATYLAAIRDHYHALRPLRLAVDSASGPLLEYLNQLAATVACRVIPARLASPDVPAELQTNAPHFAARVDGDGETCQVFDELLLPVPPERQLLLLSRAIADGDTRSRCQPCVVIEDGTSPHVIERLRRQGMNVVTCAARRADMAATMLRHDALLGGGPSGRFWHRIDGNPLPDALMTITRVFQLLSRSDEPFSTVLDREAPLD